MGKDIGLLSPGLSESLGNGSSWCSCVPIGMNLPSIHIYLNIIENKLRFWHRNPTIPIFKHLTPRQELCSKQPILVMSA